MAVAAARQNARREGSSDVAAKLVRRNYGNNGKDKKQGRLPLFAAFSLFFRSFCVPVLCAVYLVNGKKYWNADDADEHESSRKMGMRG